MTTTSRSWSGWQPVLIACAFSALFSSGATLVGIRLAPPGTARAQEQRTEPSGETYSVGDTKRLSIGTGANRYAGMVLYSSDGAATLLDLSSGGDPAHGNVGADAAALSLFATDGALLGRLGTSGSAGVPSRTTSLALNDRAGHTRLLLAVEGDGTPSIKLLATDGSVLWRTPEEPRK